MKKLVANGVVIVCMILAACLTVWPQAADTGQITGSVTDPTGAVIVGAKVTLTDKATNTSHSTESNCGLQTHFMSAEHCSAQD